MKVIEQYECFSFAYKILNSNHALIGGCSGSGKSVALNTILYAALTQPTTTLFYLIDIKRVELGMYRNLPQTLEYADTIEDAVRTLQDAVKLIESRYKTMQAKGLRKSDECPVYVLIDEYADLSMSNPAVNQLCQRISQIGRASNVHLIVCTQRPTAEVVKKTVAVNLETRLALRCMTAQDSRNILGVSGAEKLPKNGHGILQCEGYNEQITIPMVSDEDIMAVVNYYTQAVAQR